MVSSFANRWKSHPCSQVFCFLYSSSSTCSCPCLPLSTCSLLCTVLAAMRVRMRVCACVCVCVCVYACCLIWSDMSTHRNRQANLFPVWVTDGGPSSQGSEGDRGPALNWWVRKGHVTLKVFISYNLYHIYNQPHQAYFSIIPLQEKMRLQKPPHRTIIALNGHII